MAPFKAYNEYIILWYLVICGFLEVATPFLADDGLSITFSPIRRRKEKNHPILYRAVNRHPSCGDGCTSSSTARKNGGSFRIHPCTNTTTSTTTSRRDYLIKHSLSSLCFLAASSSLTTTSLNYLIPPPLRVLPANARGLVIFPCTKPLFNTYHIMRAGTTLLEEEDIWSTNPLFLTNAEAALSTKGKAQVEAAVQKLQEANIQPSVIKYSLAASSMDTSTIIKDEMKVGQNRVVPEFFFMDPRAVGAYDMMSIEQTLPAIVAMDEMEAGKDGTGGRPPPNEDGTPNETLADNSVRLRQLISGIESQYSGDTVLLVFPDGTGPALLSAMIAGIPFNQVHRLDFQPGELRLNVDMPSTLELYNERLQDSSSNDEYDAIVKSGQRELARLRSLDVEEIVSKKDIKLEKERMEIEQQQQKLAEERERLRQAKEEKEKIARIQRAKDIELERASRIQHRAAKNQPDEDRSTTLPPLFIGGVFATLIGVALAGGDNDDEGVSKVLEDEDRDLTTARNRTATTPDVNNNNAPPTRTPSAATSSLDTTDSNRLVDPDTRDKEVEPSDICDSYGQQPLLPNEAEQKRNAATKAMKDYLNEDDGGGAWLEAITEIIQEDDNDKNENSSSSDATNGSDMDSSFQ